MEEHWVTNSTDAEIIAALKEIDDSDEIRVKSDEAKLIETLVFRQKTAMTEKQRSWASDIIQKYLD